VRLNRTQILGALLLALAVLIYLLLRYRVFHG
jgi:hypothetical protein